MQAATAMQENTNDRHPLVISASRELDLNAAVGAAANVIAPLWPLATFAARSPWIGLEAETFDEVARRMRKSQGVEMYPPISMMRKAQERGEIDPAQLEEGLQRWLDLQASTVPKRLAENFCRKVLEHDGWPNGLEGKAEIHVQVKQLNAHVPEAAMDRTVLTKSRLVEQKGSLKAARKLDYHLIKWCKLYLDTAQAAWSMPGREKGFYGAWRHLAPHDPALGGSVRKILKGWPKDAEAALHQALEKLGIAGQKVIEYLEAHLLALPGWAGMLRWRASQTTQEQSLLTEYLAVRLTLEWAILAPHLPQELDEADASSETMPLDQLIAAWAACGYLPAEGWINLSDTEQKAWLMLVSHFDQPTRNRLLLEAWERTYASRLQRTIQLRVPMKQSVPAMAQFTFCIDVRSEPIRRRLEEAGPFETFGMAGFFGLPIATRALGASRLHPALPVILDPRHLVQESAQMKEQKEYDERRRTEQLAGHTFNTMKHHLFAGMLLPEASGPWLGLTMLGRSLFPRGAGRLIRKVRKGWQRKPKTSLTLDPIHPAHDSLPIGMTEAEQAIYVRQALQSMGLTANFAPLVVICGHGSHSTNNPYAAKLNCGACGGAAGGFNARVLATLANKPQVRVRLLEEGIEIPDNTAFAAAEHNTTLDELQWVYVPELAEKANKAYRYIRSVLPRVRKDALAGRLPKLPHLQEKIADPIAESERLAEDWSEVRPEWGLARNAAFIVGRRELTEGCDLEGRAFLQSYNWQMDEDGALLAGIIGGPAAVGQWINLQYYASTVAPHYYGSGSKATQTVTAGLGVMQGNASDLMTGLPWQSVMRSNGEAYHAPLRLLLVIEAPRAYVERLLVQDNAFKQKVANGWLRLATIDPQGRWENWDQLK